ncbi:MULTISPECIES: glucosaminidase domain-containing protein [Enterococcus]|nr:glucosaminidase domain-containing protein [Enterococcus sp. 665A]MBO1343164.1 peptidoglycan DD-metalloendopeptidase family protein [Enterococcus sp. 665A]
MWEQEVFRSRSKHPTLKKGIIGTTTLLGSASIVLNSTSVFAHAAEETVSTENKVASDTAPNNGSITFESSTVATQAEATKKLEPVTSEVEVNTNGKENEPRPEANAETSNQSTINEQINESTPILVQPEEENKASISSSNVNADKEIPTTNSSEQKGLAQDTETDEEASTPEMEAEDEETAPLPTPEPEKEKPAPTPEPEKPKQEPKKETPEPEKPEAPVSEQPKSAEPEKEVPIPESEFEVIYVQQPEQQSVQEPVTEPIVIHSPENIVPVGPQQTTPSHGSIKFNRNVTTAEFIEEIGEPARKTGQEQELYASVMIAQAILESGSGGSQLAQAPNYNLFGIKGEHEGKSVSFATQEDTGGGNMTTIQASFRAYDDYEDCFEDYAKLLKEGLSGNPDFYKGAWKTTTENYEEATAFLTGKYATDTSYNKKLNGLIETYNLTQYDHPKEEAEATNQVASSGYLLPLNDFVVSSSFGMRGSEFHRGVDLAAGEGMPIFASKSGTVLIAEYHYSWGNYVVIQHENGETTLYAHQRNFAVNAGERVEQGQTIGFVGSTGNSTGSHLHFELCLDSTLAVERLVDPATVLF